MPMSTCFVRFAAPIPTALDQDSIEAAIADPASHRPRSKMTRRADAIRAIGVATFKRAGEPLFGKPSVDTPHSRLGKQDLQRA